MRSEFVQWIVMTIVVAVVFCLTVTLLILL